MRLYLCQTVFIESMRLDICFLFFTLTFKSQCTFFVTQNKCRPPIWVYETNIYACLMEYYIQEKWKIDLILLLPNSLKLQ